MFPSCTDMSFRTKVATRNGAYRERPLSEYDDVHVQRLEVCRAIWVLVERAETDKVIHAEEFDLLARLLCLNVFCGKRMNTEHLEMVNMIIGEPKWL